MPLVKNARVTGDPFVHVADDAEIPAEGAVLISAARFLGMRKWFCAVPERPA